jgi:hypothetical protein
MDAGPSEGWAGWTAAGGRITAVIKRKRPANLAYMMVVGGVGGWVFYETVINTSKE